MASVTDLAFITAQLDAYYRSIGQTPTGPGSGPTDIAYYAKKVQATGGWTHSTYKHEDNINYWEGRIVKDLAAVGKQPGDPIGGAPPAPAPEPPPSSGGPRRYSTGSEILNTLGEIVQSRVSAGMPGVIPTGREAPQAEEMPEGTSEAIAIAATNIALVAGAWAITQFSRNQPTSRKGSGTISSLEHRGFTAEELAELDAMFADAFPN